MKKWGKKCFAVLFSVVMVFSMTAVISIYYEKQVWAEKTEKITDSVETKSVYELTSDKCEISIPEISPEYTGKAITLDISVAYGGVELTENADYKVTYTSNINAGEAKITIEGTGAYYGTVEKTFTISPVDISSDKVIVDDSNLEENLEFNGLDRTPILIFTYNGMRLNVNADFTAEYKDNFYPGTATITIKGIDNYTGTLTKTFHIVKMPIGNVTIRTGFDVAKQLIVTVNNGSYDMEKGVDYTYSTVTDTEGNITITFAGLGDNYSGTCVRVIEAKDNPNSPQNVPKTETIRTAKKITVKKPSIKSVKNIKGKKAKLSWKKLSGVNGYKIRYSIDKKFKKAKTKLLKKNVSRYTLKKLKTKKYYIQIRAYKVYQGKKYFGKWSKSKTVIVKK